VSGRLRLVARVAAGVLLSIAAHAQDPDPLAAQLDRLVSTKRVPAKSDDDPAGQIECTYYRDFMLRESGTDTPDPNDATLVPIAAGAPRPPCDMAEYANGLMLKTQGYSYVGRKDHFLLFSGTDPNGAVPFMLLDTGGGKVIFEDATPPDRGIQTVVLDNGTLHLGYKRAFNASCSLLMDPANCWSSLVADGKIPNGLAQPARDFCAAAYKEEQAPAEDPSIVSYLVDTIIDASGHVSTTAHGTIDCAPMP
jgi:hypothetical protein